jgi:hypothetical protein
MAGCGDWSCTTCSMPRRVELVPQPATYTFVAEKRNRNEPRL